MSGKIPSNFIDELIARVDIVDVIDRRVPLTKKGKEYQACCPFHDEKTPSFTVSPAKQFYHCFGCGAHGTAIGFLMEYANLGFVEAIEELADGVAMQVPKTGGDSSPVSQERPQQLLDVVAKANDWFQQQLRQHPEASQAIKYLKSRGLDGVIAAEFGVGFAPDSWDDLARALGKTPEIQSQLMKAGLVMERRSDSSSANNASGYYDRFRGRIIFPIEDHRGRVVGFGGRILGDGEPKYLNSPETPLFHKGSELYGLHRARREIGVQQRSIVVEGYMDVISLAQFGVNNAVATLGTATTRTHLQRLFRMAPEVVFCFDGDRAGRDAGWKALQVALPEMQDGRQVGFLFLPDGEDPDTIVRSEGEEAFQERVKTATSLPDFLFDHLTSEVDMSRMDGKARMVSLVKPLVEQFPAGALKNMMIARLSALSGLGEGQLGANQGAPGRPVQKQRRRKPAETGQLSPVALATSLLLQHPELGEQIEEPEELRKLGVRGADVFLRIVELSRSEQGQTTARLLEAFREESYHGYLEMLASRPHMVTEDSLSGHLQEVLHKLSADQVAARREDLLKMAQQKSLDPEEKAELSRLLKERVDNA